MAFEIIFEDVKKENWAIGGMLSSEGDSYRYNLKISDDELPGILNEWVVMDMLKEG